MNGRDIDIFGSDFAAIVAAGVALSTSPVVVSSRVDGVSSSDINLAVVGPAVRCNVKADADVARKIVEIDNFILMYCTRKFPCLIIISNMVSIETTKNLYLTYVNQPPRIFRDHKS
mmetsp:Transcript_13049/g.19922  ORF Transcript_13049/g.19922 Transcript_13049/m.19922 type:complete len:116 (+) Transcript_13049:664-1011(+)